MYIFQDRSTRMSHAFRLLSNTIVTVSRIGEPARRETVSAPGGLAPRDLSQGEDRTFGAEWSPCARVVLGRGKYKD